MTIHSFDIKEAEKYGILGAVLLHHIRFWVQKNAANEHNFNDGKYWTYNSVSAFSKLFPYATAKQIRKALDDLEAAGVLFVGCYNENPYDRTRWFSCHIDLPCGANEIGLQGKSLTNTDIKPDSKQPLASDLKMLIDSGVTEQTAKDFLQIRKAKKAPLTKTALDGIKREAEKASYPLENAVKECVIRGWQAFKSEWVKPTSNSQQQKPANNYREV